MAAALGAVANLGLAQAPAPSDPLADLQRQVDALRRELAELKAEKAAERPGTSLEREVSAFSSRLQEEGGGTVTAPNAGKITLGGSYRARIHYVRNRDFDQHGGNDDDYTTHRFRLNAGVELDEHTKVFAQIRSAFLWGTQSGSFAAEASNGDVTLHQGYGEFTDLMGSGWDLRLGRQEFVYGDERILSNIDWEEFGRVWDGAKLSTKYDDLGVDFLWAKAAESFTAFPGATTGSDIDLYGVWITYSGSEDFSVDVHVLPIEDRSVESLFVHLGARARAKVEMFDIGGEFDAVRDRGDGDNSHVTYNESYLLAADAGLSFEDVEGKPRIGVGWSQGTASYVPVVPDLHRYAGIMDVVTPFVNLIDWEANVSISPMEDWTLSGAYHVFQFENTPAAAGDETLGHELDVVLAGACTDHLRVEVGYGHFFPRAGFEAFESGLVGGLTPGTSLAFNPWTPFPAGASANDSDLIYIQFDVPF